LDDERTYLKLPLQDFLDEIASANVMPGAGFVAAFGLAMAAALVTMTARVSRSHWPEARAVAAQAETLRIRVTPLGAQNVQAYADALSALRGESAPEGSRDESIAAALGRAAGVPLAICEAAADVTALAAAAAERVDPSVRADAVAAALIAHACSRAAATLVRVNLGTTSGDQRVSSADDLVGSASVALERALATVA
jgi:formiminotetrahydrofolate cyclodeaminase